MLASVKDVAGDVALVGEIRDGNGHAVTGGRTIDIGLETVPRHIHNATSLGNLAIKMS